MINCLHSYVAAVGCTDGLLRSTWGVEAHMEKYIIKGEGKTGNWKGYETGKNINRGSTYTMVEMKERKKQL